MVQITVKGINERYHVFASYDDADMFFQQLEKRLRICQRAYAGYFEAFFHVTFLQKQDVVRLFQTCEICKTLILGMNEEALAEKSQVLEKDLHGGKQYVFHHPLILLGNISTMAYVISDASMYVIGSVKGTIDLRHGDCCLGAAHMDANVRICDTPFQNLTSFSPCSVYYEQRRVVMRNFKEELQWEKQ